MLADLLPETRESDPDEYVPNVLVLGLNRDGTLLTEER